ncbi:MAG TPA: hypothetical protein VF103_17140 [Polyangiaceae bacterium]
MLASVCPKNTTAVGNDPVADPDYGYNPAVGAMVSRLTPYFSRHCLPHPLAVDVDGRVACSVVEAKSPESACACEGERGLFELDAERSSAIRAELARRGYCDGSASVSCAGLCLCELEQLSGDELTSCQTPGTDEKSLAGFCYVDGATGDPDLIATCPAHERQDLRFMGDEEPHPWFRLLVCPGPSAGR